jgi:hypothetical protein
MDARISVTEGMIVMLEFALALGSFMSGVGLLLAPDGHFLGWTTESLRGTPFSDYMIPALMLVAIGGVLPLIVATAALRRRAWATWGHLMVGSLLVLWVGGQLLWIGYVSLLQPIFGALGFIIAALALVAIVTTRNESRVREQPRQRVAPHGAR